MDAHALLETVIAAHGGRPRWQAVERIEARLSSAGLAFSLHLQARALEGLRLTLRPHAREVTLHGYGGPGWRGIWVPDQVRLLDPQGDLVTRRIEPRAMFSRLDRQVRWDRLDLLYFAGYALWNYLSFPFILEEPGVSLLESSAPDRLVARFDASLPTHSAVQTFHLDAAGLLTRHDYTADVIGRWARAANFCLASDVVEGLRFYTRRRVYPRLLGDAVLPFPTLVWIELAEVSVRFAASPAVETG